MNNEISFRLAEAKDKPFLLRLRNEAMNSHIANAGLTPSNEIHMERINYRFDCASIIIFAGMEIGILKVIKEGELWDLVQIQLTPSSQGKGIGRKIILEVLAQAFKNNSGVKLSVFKTNPAKNLYTELGFKTYLGTETTYEMQALPGKVK
ncbi:MAG: GNAT family N-acetyltransferase [Pseudomonadota bacterium]